MDTIVNFPGLALEITVNRRAFNIFGLDIYWYGLLIGLGLLLAILFAYRRAKDFGINIDKLIDAVIVGTIVGVIGARLYFVVFSPSFKGASFWEIFNTRRGGLAFYGAVIFAAAAALPLCRWKKIKFRPVTDMLAIGFAIGQGVGRWGNFVNQEAFGTNTSLPWGMISTATTQELRNQAASLLERGIVVDPNLPVHPTFLYESIACLLGALLFILYIKRRRFDGEIALLYVVWNGTVRAIIEGLRTDSLYLGSSNIRISQLLAIAGAVAALALIVIVRIKIKKSDDPAYLLPYVKTPEWQTELAEIEANQTAKRNKKQKNQAQDGEDISEKAETSAEKMAEDLEEKPVEHAAEELENEEKD